MAEFVHSSMAAAGLVSKESMAISEQESIETGCYGCITAVQINNEKVSFSLIISFLFFSFLFFSFLLFLSFFSSQTYSFQNFAFIEFRTPEDATGAVSLDGINLEGHALKLRRPKDYVPLPEAPTATDEKFIPGIVSTNVPDTENKIFVGGLPSYLNEVFLNSFLSSSFSHIFPRNKLKSFCLLMGL